LDDVNRVLAEMGDIARDDAKAARREVLQVPMRSVVSPGHLSRRQS